MKNIKTLFRKNIAGLAPYSTARDEYQGAIGTYLDANESPYDTDYNRYPDPYQKKLKARIAQIKGIDPGKIFAGNGSDEAIDLAFRVFCEPRIDNVVTIAPTYGMYRVAAAINDVKCREVQLGVGFSLDPAVVLAATDSRTKLIFICSPNNPTGNSFDTEDIVGILEAFAGIVVLDEAYIDFSSGRGLLERLGEFQNLIILQTLSKAWGMAGLRLGLAFADEEIIGAFTRVKYPYNINAATQKIALQQLDNNIYTQLEEIKNERRAMVEKLGKCQVIQRIYPSDANFILVKVEEPRRIYNLLIDSGIIVRDRSRIEGCEGCLRITVGRPEENKKLIDALNSIAEQ